MNGRYRVTVLAVELYDPLLIQHAISRAGGDGARTGATLAVEVPGGFGPAIVAASSSRAEADRLLASLTSAGIEAIVVDDGHPLLNKIRRAWMRLEGRDPDAKTTAPEQRPPELPVDPLAPPGPEPDRVNFKLHRNADRAEVNPIDAVFGELRVHLVRLVGLIVVLLLFALPWYFMLGRLSPLESLKGGGGEEVFRLVEGSGGALPKVALKGGPSDGSGGDPQREAEQMAAGAGSGDDGKSGPPGGKGGAGPSPLNEPTEAGGGNGPGGGKGGAPGSGGDPNAANDQLKRTALLLIIAGLLGLVAGLVAGWLSFSRGKPGLRVVKSTWFWVAAAALAGGIALGHYNSRQAELRAVAAKVQHDGSGSGSGSGNQDGSGSGPGEGSSAGSGSGSAAADGSGSGATAARSADAPKSVASQVAAMQGPPRANLAELLRKLREKQAAPAKAQARKGASKADRPAPGSASAPSATGDAAAAAGEPPSSPATGSNRAGRGSAATPPASAPTTPANSPAAASSTSGSRRSPAAADRATTPSEAAATTPSEAAAAAPNDDSAEPGAAGNAPAAKAPAATAKQSPVESKVAAMGDPPCEAQRNPYKAMLCKLRKEREAAAKAAEEAAEAKPGPDPNRPGADKSAPGQPTGGKSKKGNQPAANNQQPPMSRGLVAGVGFSVGLLLGLLFSLFYHRFYRR
jgi:hypothetical protein